MQLVTRMICLTAVLMAAPAALNADMFMDSLLDESAAVIGGGVGQNTTDDFFGLVTGLSPLVINGTNQVSSSFAPEVGDVIGRDLVSTGAGNNLTGGTAEWVVEIPTIDAEIVDNTFNLTTSFNASTAFLGNAFSGSQPNALDFELFFDGASQGTFQAQSGVHNAAALNGTINAGNPISEVRVVMSFPAGNSFDAASEEFRVFVDSLSVDYSYEFNNSVPEPTAVTLVALFGMFGFVRRKK